MESSGQMNQGIRELDSSDRLMLASFPCIVCRQNEYLRPAWNSLGAPGKIPRVRSVMYSSSSRFFTLTNTSTTSFLIGYVTDRLSTVYASISPNCPERAFILAGPSG